MGCLLSCIRVKKHGRRKNHPIDSKKRELFEQRNEILSIFIRDEYGSRSEREASLNSRASTSDTNLDIELQNEAKFLKSCGALLNCPVELCKTSYEKLSQALHESQVSDQNVKLLDASYEKLDLDEQPKHFPDSPEHSLNDHTICTKHESICCESTEHERLRKLDHFEEFPRIDISPSQMETPNHQFGSSNSPYPTPLNISNEMQTPGTAYTGTADKLRTGKKVKVRAEYVFPVLKPVENIPQWKQKREDCLYFNKSSGQMQNMKIFVDYIENIPNPIPTDFDYAKEKVTSDANLCNMHCELHGQQLLPDTRTSHLGERYNNENATAEETPLKEWDGKGIPNTTTKYKEDQKVNWHATPFVVRLEKALSDDKHFPHRKISNANPEFNEESKKIM